MERLFIGLIGLTILSAAYLLTIFLFDVLLRGFAPILPSRPWAIDRIFNNLKLKKYKKVYGFGSGKSGFLREFELLFPDTEIIGVEYDRFPYTVAITQMWLRKIFYFGRSNIKIVLRKVHRVDIGDADVIYSHLYPEHMQGLGHKIKYECKPGTMIVSNGFIIQDIDSYKNIELGEKKGRFSWLSKNREFFKSKKRKSKKSNIAYFYEV